MNIKKIIQHARKPALYENGSAVMWTDPYISKQLLDVHLNPDVDLASRRKSTIESTAAWILEEVPLQKMNILDLGCGPGLYAENFACKGHRVTGVDFSENSIRYARHEADKKALDITYLRQNYLELDLEPDQYDLVLLIYTDFGPLLPDERHVLLRHIKHVLKPGGFFIFDVLNDKELESKTTPINWEATAKGFWKKNPYLALSNSFLYEENKVILYQHIILDEKDQMDIYRFWTHFFSQADLKAILKDHGFKDPVFHENILPSGDLWSGEHVTFCISKT
jgi:2-polyprenyl-3-methyl-5-hydroxy-6-metoxy-1,4-benzoquinol methylase